MLARVQSVAPDLRIVCLHGKLPVDEIDDRMMSFVEGATEQKGSWWPDWLDWIRARSPETVNAKGARIPGEGKLKPIEDAPGRYVREH